MMNALVAGGGLVKLQRLAGFGPIAALVSAGALFLSFVIAVRDREAPGDSKLDVPVRIQYAVALNRIESLGVVSYSDCIV